MTNVNKAKNYDLKSNSYKVGFYNKILEITPSQAISLQYLLSCTTFAESQATAVAVTFHRDEGCHFLTFLTCVGRCEYYERKGDMYS